jgi:inorganic pyrophosphatase
MAAVAAEPGWSASQLTLRNDSGAVFYLVGDEHVSPWHDIPFVAGQDAATGRPLLSFVCEIPRGTSAKVEIHKTRPHNPLVQDVNQDGSPRFYAYSPAIVNYGAVPQTWEDPAVPDEHTGLGGDNDPIDVLQLNASPCSAGAVQRVGVLGALALVDGGETDWKLLVVDVDDPDAPSWSEVTDIPDQRLHEVRDWYRMYKTAEGKGENVYGLGGEPIGAEQALDVARQTHALWGAPMGRARCTFNGEQCWGMNAGGSAVRLRDEL